MLTMLLSVQLGVARRVVVEPLCPHALRFIGVGGEDVLALRERNAHQLRLHVDVLHRFKHLHRLADVAELKGKASHLVASGLRFLVEWSSRSAAFSTNNTADVDDKGDSLVAVGVIATRTAVGRLGVAGPGQLFRLIWRIDYLVAISLLYKVHLIRSSIILHELCDHTH